MSAGVIQAVDLPPRSVIVYAPHGACSRFRTATQAMLMGENRLGGMALTCIVAVDGQAERYSVPPAWINPPGAPAPSRPHLCVVIPFPHGRRTSPGEAS